MKEKVFEILKAMLGEDATGIYCSDDVIEGGLEEDFYSTIKDNNFGFLIGDTMDITVEHGCTRLVLIPKEEEFVIKLPITATYELVYICIFQHNDDENSTSTIELCDADYCYEEEHGFDDYEDLGELISVDIEFRMIKSLNPDCNLMDEENALIENANEALAKILVPNEFVGNYNGIPVYIQKKVEETLCASRPYFRENKLTKEQITTAKNVMTKAGYHSLDTILINDLIEQYGEKDTQLILEGIQDLALDDLHGNNIGYFKDGSIGIIDYAGYDEENVWCWKH